MSMFDPQAFLSAQQTEVNEKRALIPTHNPASPDGLYPAIVGQIEKTKSGTIGKGEKIGQPWLAIVVPVKLQLPAEVQALGLPAEFTLTEQVFIDLTPTGAIDNGKGKNNQQRTWREATGMNKPGEPFSWQAMAGRPIRVQLQHEEYNGNFLEKVKAVLPA